jgi:hypothetical protein
VLGAIATGISVIGFVVFFGGMVAWARYEALGIPPNTAVSRVPRAELVATGASFLVPALIAALTAVALAGAVAYLARLKSVAAREHDTRESRDELRAKTLIAKDAVVHSKQSLASAQREVNRDAERERDRARDDIEEAETALMEAIKAEAKAEAAYKSAGEWTPRDRKFIRLASAAPLILVEIVAAEPYKVWWWKALIIVAIAIAASMISLIILDATQRWGWFAVAGFLSVGFVIAAGTFFRTQEEPKISPIAVMRDAGPPAVGFLVTRTSDNVIIGVPSVDPSGGRFVNANTQMVEVPIAAVVEMAVGPELDRYGAYKRALAVALQLCSRPKAEKAKTDTAATKATAQKEKKQQQCTPEQIAELHAKLVRAKTLPAH